MESNNKLKIWYDDSLNDGEPFYISLKGPKDETVMTSLSTEEAKGICEYLSGFFVE